RAKHQSAWPRPDCHACAFGYQMKRLLGGENLMGLPGRNSLSSGCLQYCTVDRWIDTSWKDNPFVFCEMPKLKLLVVRRRVCLRHNRAKLSFSERNDRQLGVSDWSCNKRHMKFTREHISH